MKFEYEITADDYAASQILYYKLSIGYNRVKRAVYWILAGVFLILVAWGEWGPHWSQVFLAGIGVWWIYAGTICLFPRRYLRRAYRGVGLSGKKFQADLDEEGFEVIGDLCSWRLRWPAVSVKGENKYVFIFFGGTSIFMFGKQYLTDEQQRELRKLAALSTQDPN
jgi:hypothetical protein